MNPKEEQIKELQDILLQKARELQQDTTMKPIDKLDKVDVILNISKILDNYDYNIQVLQKDLIRKKYEERSI